MKTITQEDLIRFKASLDLFGNTLSPEMDRCILSSFTGKLHISRSTEVQVNTEYEGPQDFLIVLYYHLSLARNRSLSGQVSPNERKKASTNKELLQQGIDYAEDVLGVRLIEVCPPAVNEDGSTIMGNGLYRIDKRS